MFKFKTDIFPDIFPVSLAIFRFFRALRRKGHYDIYTQITYIPSAAGPGTYRPVPREYQFATTIYFDGDLLNKIPDIEHYAGDPDWYSAYQVHYRMHLEKVRVFLTELERSTAFWGEALVFPVFLFINSKFLFDLYELVTSDTLHQDILTWVMDMGILIGAVYLRKFFVGLGIQLLMRLAMWGIQMYRKRKAKKQEAALAKAVPQVAQ